MITYINICTQLLQRNADANPKPNSRRRNSFSSPKSELEFRFRFILTQTLALLHIHRSSRGHACPCPALHTSTHPSRLTGPPWIVSSQLWHLSLLVIHRHHRPLRDAAAVPSFSGTAVVTQTKAAVWTDSRYWVQAERQMDCSWELEKDGMRTHFVITCCGDPEHTASNKILLVWVI